MTEKLDKIRCIVAGSRSFFNYFHVKDILDKFFDYDDINVQNDLEIVCGMAPGVDMLGYKWAKENNVPIIEFPAKWDNMNRPSSEIGYRNGKPYWKFAGFHRNEEMAKYANDTGKVGALIAFWDGKSNGTANMIAHACYYKLTILVEKV